MSSVLCVLAGECNTRMSRWWNCLSAHKDYFDTYSYAQHSVVFGLFFFSSCFIGQSGCIFFMKKCWLPSVNEATERMLKYMYFYRSRWMCRRSPWLRIKRHDVQKFDWYFHVHLSFWNDPKTWWRRLHR